MTQSSRTSRTLGRLSARIGILASVGATALTLPAVAHAQAAAADAQTSVSDIVVTARREGENLQNVPVSVQVVTGDAVQKLSITQATEISKLAPGLTLSSGDNVKVVLRGVTWAPGSGTPSTPIYLNEVPFDPESTLQSIFDIGQIEVLRGPQGTSRGAPSISGAVTITTKRPDIDQFGGYIQGMYGTGGRRGVQGAINVPVIKDVLAIRAAAFIEDSDGTRIRSVNSTIDPSFKSRTYRLSALFQPTDTVSIVAMYQRRRQKLRSFTQVAGTGSPGLAAAGIPANFNGPALSYKDRKSVQDAPSYGYNYTDMLTVNASWEVFGQKLSYNFGRQFDRSPTKLLAQDFGNMLPGFEPYNRQKNIGGLPFFQTHEIHLSSISNPDRPFDYDIGWFQKRSHGTINYGVPTFLAGAFGEPGIVGPGTPPGAVTTPDGRYILPSSSDIALSQSFNSFYGNVRFYLDEKTELSGGLSILQDKVPVRLNVTTGAALSYALPRFIFGGLPCSVVGGIVGQPGLIDSAGYPGACDAQVPAGVGNSTQNYNKTYSAALYNFSLSHKFSDDFLIYATTGSSFRTGLPAINNTGLPANLLVPEPEKAKSYEIGVKTSIGRRLRINADVFQINYKNQLTSFGGVPYFNSSIGQLATTSIAFYSNVDARVRGAELEIAAEPVDNLSLGANFSYSKIKSKGGQVPCSTGPTPTAANPINFCPSPKGETLNTAAPFQATANGSYTVPMGPLEAYVRFNVNYQGKNPNYQNFKDPVTGKYRGITSYAIVDLFAGLTGNRGGWDVGVYAKNVFNKQVELTRELLLNNIYAPFAGADDGYDTIRTSAPREIGVTLRYAFGSR